MIRGRFGRRRAAGAAAPDAGDYIEIDPASLRGLFAVPGWLRDIGLMAWLVVGIALMVVGLVWLLGLTDVIVAPVITASVIAAVASPLVAWLSRRRLPRGAAAALVLLGFMLVGTGMTVLVIAGITAETADISAQLGSAKDTLEGWLKDIGVDPTRAADAKDAASAGASHSVKGLLDGVVSGVEQLSSLVFFLAMTTLSLFFLLKDGPQIRRFAESHLALPDDISRTITSRVLSSLRGYFLGVTIVAAFSAVVVGLGTLILGVPLLGTIVAVTFLAGYVPYLGAWTAATFSVLIALGAEGPDAAAGMIVVQLLANGMLQQMVQPFAMGAALGIHPLAVLIVTIAGGALFGAVGLILAAPLTAAATRISADLAKARAAEEREDAADAEPEPPKPEPPPGAAPAPA